MKTLTDYHLSEFLSLILRHRPGTIQLTLDPYGYANIDDIIAKAKENGIEINKDELIKVVHYSDKKRFKIIDGRIRAIQGHSFEIQIEEKSQQPPDLLYHGTKVKLKDKITQQGLLGMRRSLVQLYADYATAYMHNIEPLVFEIDALKMYNDGFEFYLYDGVWQTKTVPAGYLTVKALHEIKQLKKITVTKHTFYSKLINAEIKLEPRFNSEPRIYVNDCFLCGCKRTSYSVDKKIVRCDEMTHERPAKRHSLPGKIISFEQLQTECEIIVKQVFEIGIKKDKELQVGSNLLYQGIGIRFYCPACNERDFISNMTKFGEEYKCRKCNIDLFRIDKATEITQKASAWE